MTFLTLTGCSAPGSEPSPDSAALAEAEFLKPEDLTTGSHGITVTGARGLSERAVEITVSTEAVGPDVPGGQNSVIVVRPEHYDPSQRYPAVYLLNGTEPDVSPPMQWYETGHAEQITAGLPVIAVIPSGGKEGWYTDWSHSVELTQKWATYHLDQLVPWVDEHLPTRADRDHRAVLGSSMGGYGAVRYAEERPDLFGEAISLSGLLDTSSDQAKFHFREASKDSTGEPESIFGDGETTTDEQWRAHDPVAQSDRLEDVTVQLFAGEGTESSEDIEPMLRRGAQSLAHALDDQGSRYSYTMYGRPEGCNGEHSFECWRPAATVALERWARRAGARPTDAQPAVPSAFEHVTSGSGS